MKTWPVSKQFTSCEQKTSHGFLTQKKDWSGDKFLDCGKMLVLPQTSTVILDSQIFKGRRGHIPWPPVWCRMQNLTQILNQACNFFFFFFAMTYCIEKCLVLIYIDWIVTYISSKLSSEVICPYSPMVCFISSPDFSLLFIILRFLSEVSYWWWCFSTLIEGAN